MIFQIKSWLKYRWHAQGAHLLHSPFIFELYTKVIRSQSQTRKPEAFRKELLQSKSRIRQMSVGAPSRVIKRKEAALSKVAAISLLPARYANLLYRLVAHFKPAHLLELGTSAGITTLYLSYANAQSTIHTIEGNPDMAAVARDIFQRSGRSHIVLHEKLFSEALPEILTNMPAPDFIFLDGDHRKEAVIEHVRHLLPHIPEQGILILDDIHWNNEMLEAWKEIKQMPEVTVTIDLFRMGLVFFKKNQAKQHFTLWY
jgi:predicted O-methyltransferase YrrM